MGEDTKNYKVQITIAIISLVGVIGAAIFGNWDKIFPVDNPARPPEIRLFGQSSACLKLSAFGKRAEYSKLHIF